jgi:hypothetical protein
LSKGGEENKWEVKAERTSRSPSSQRSKKKPKRRVRSKKAHPLPKGESKRGFASLIKLIPLPLDKGKGIKGMGLIEL